MSASFDKDKESLVKGFSPMHDHPLQHQLFYGSSNAVNGSSNLVSSPSQSPAPSSPSMVGYHMPMYGNNMARYPVQMNLSQKLQPQQQSGMNHNPLAHHSLSAPTGNSPVSPHIDLSTLNSSQPNTPYLARQLSYAQMSRQSASPHHHARTAAALARGTTLSTAVTITDPNNPTKTLTGLGAKRGGRSTEGHDNEGVPAKVNDPNPLQSWSSLDMGGMGLQNLSATLFNAYEFLTTLYINHNNLTYISSAISNLVNLKVLDASGNKLTSIPPEMGMLVQLKELLLFDNSLETLPNELGTLYQLETLGLEGNPIHSALKSLLLKEGSQAVIVSLRENCPVGMPPPEREWITVDGDSSNDDPNDKITVFSYNILCERLATASQYGYTPSWALSWEYRRELLVPEIVGWGADIICLQEVELGEYENYLRDDLKKLGDYNGAFWPKSRAKTMGEKERMVVDGCAVFFRSSKFNLIEQQVLEYNQSSLKRDDFKKTADIYNRVMTKDNIAVMLMLENKHTHARILVVNTHLHWDPSFADVKLVQIGLLMEEAIKFAERHLQPTPESSPEAPVYESATQLPTIICGDFNSVPSSGVYEFLSRGSVKQDHEDFGNHAYGAYTTEGLTHDLNLRSAYSSLNELPFTNYTPGYKGVLDYIFPSANTFSVSGVLGPIDKEYISRQVGFPNPHFPSDHIPIMCELVLKTPAKEKKETPSVFAKN
ncbi:hypothetical protein K450DRAFT_250045 [Umbelopsis ramanniana AG]|uniref:CCR4-Not complex 3'-5'-exoribonuclease subunit Ccr4 n=1 Tax=Umbelopsis ramanniana AG TaxID=1314678 RepID=A0AAD5E7P6_UMBRA|nr:uncharacterized protein K450DRAFT_250045 [Umbelopsis ramanniana AG]KAI8577796.1 hypothetical protein K450DRAFT_250045 [Umbelopsis ramanniana AG]